MRKQIATYASSRNALVNRFAGRVAFRQSAEKTKALRTKFHRVLDCSRALINGPSQWRSREADAVARTKAVARL
jgi:hypothetical protein